MEYLYHNPVYYNIAFIPEFENRMKFSKESDFEWMWCFIVWLV